MDKRYCIGIDLGTSNSVLAIADDQGPPRVLPVTQLAGPNALVESSQLPSVAYVPHRAEFPEGSLRLPWDGEDRPLVIGGFARDHGALVPERMISSAKSWLCNSAVDREAAILPWNSDIEEERLSPLAVSTAYLTHLRRALLFSEIEPGRLPPLEEAMVVLTVPASFDEAARTLTHEAAVRAGWGQVTLLEEPQAAFYSWIGSHEEQWRSQITTGDIILVCDLGGGTADFSLIAVQEEDGALQLRRISVGEHILLGGDNMDLALAHAVSAELESEGTTLDHWQFLALVHLARIAKEQLLINTELEELPISIPKRGGSLFQSTVSAKVRRETLQSILLEGFFPLTPVNEMPKQPRQAGLRELGLPYAADPALSRHLARFLTSSLQNVLSEQSLSALIGSADTSRGFLAPTAVLFNGGVFKAPLIRERVLGLLREWSGGSVKELTHGDPDLAVARGAARYGETVRSGKGLRIRGGTSRSFYLGIESSMPAVPGIQPPINGLCVVPQGTEEGSELVLAEEEFGLLVGEPAEFRFFSSTTRAGDHPGDLIRQAARELDELPPLQLSLPADAGQAGEVLPVRLRALVTPLGTLELWMHHEPSDRRWKLELNLRTSQEHTRY